MAVISLGEVAFFFIFLNSEPMWPKYIFTWCAIFCTLYSSCSASGAWDRQDFERRFDRIIDRNTAILLGTTQDNHPSSEFDIFDMSLLVSRRASLILVVYNLRTAFFHRMIQTDHFECAQLLTSCNLAFRDLPLPNALLSLPDEVVLPESMVQQFRLIEQQISFSTRRTIGFMIAQAKLLIAEIKKTWHVQLKRMNDDRNDVYESIVRKATANQLPAELNRAIAEFSAPFA